MECRLTSANHPQSNGLDERFNQTLQLLKFIASDQMQWDCYLDTILFSHQVSCHDSTKHSPFLLVYGQQPRLPVEFNSKLSDNSSEECMPKITEVDTGSEESVLQVIKRNYMYILHIVLKLFSTYTVND